MRILNIMLAKVRGGVETMGLRYHEALRAEGFEVMSLGHPEGMLAEGVKSWAFRPLTCNSGFDPVAAMKLRASTRDFQPHLVLTHGNRATGLSLTPFTGTSDRTVQVLHNQSHKAHVLRTRAVMCVSASVRNELLRAYPGVNAIDMANFSHLQLSPVKTAPRRPPVIGALGRMHEIKGFDVLIRSAAALRDRGIDFRLKLAGDGPELGALKQLSVELGLEAQVEFVGWVAEPGQFLKTIDLFVVPSRYEAFGLVIIEAMAAGVPVITSDIEGPCEILKGGQLGTLFRS
ncbi:MAG: glycosyltransferase, partial [Asticcacaulis sp.]